MDAYEHDRAARVANKRVPHAPYITGDDNLRITSLNAAAGVTLTIIGRFLDYEGHITPIREVHVPNTDRTVKTTDYRLGDGWLLELAVFASAGSPLVGQTFVRASLVRGLAGATQELSTLAQGFCTAAQRLAFPGSPVITTTEKPGAIRSITGTNPAAGVEISETVPTGARWRLLLFSAAITTDATVASRQPVLTIDNGTTLIANFINPATRAASGGCTFTWATGLPLGVAVNNNFGLQGLPLDTWLLAGFRIRTNTLSLQAGDDYAAPQLLVEESLEGN